MKKLPIIAVALLVVAGGGGAAWWKFGRNHDPLANARAFLEKGDTRSALIELRNAVRTNPNNPEAHFRLGTLQLQSGDPIAAEKELKEARAEGIKAPELPVMIAQTYLQQGRGKDLLAEFPPEGGTPELASQMLILRSFAQIAEKDPNAAQASMDEAERLAPNSPNPPLAAARIAVSRNDMGLAEQKITRALALDGKRPDSLLLKAQILNARGDRRGAIEALNSALAVTPNFAAALLERGNIFLSTNEDAKARVDVDKVLVDQPNSAPATYLLAVLQTRAKDYKGSDASFAKLSALMGRFPRAYYFDSITKYNLGQMEQATESAKLYVQRAPGDAEGIKLYSRILLASGHGDQALQVMDRSVKAGVADAEMLDLMGRAYETSGKKNEALKSFDKAAAMAPQNAEILTHLASAKMGVGDALGATSDYTRSLQMAPDQTTAGEALVVAALASGDVEKASAALNTLRAKEGKTETVGMLNGSLLMMKQDLDGASKQFQELIKANPNAARPKLALVPVLLLQSRSPEAEALLGQILQQDPANQAALNALLQILLADGRVAAAVTVVENAYLAAPSNQSLMLALSDLYVRAGTPEKAVQLLDRSEKAGGSPLVPVLAARARAQIAMKQLQDAIATYRRILAQIPGDISVLRAMVALQTDSKDWAGARTAVRDALLLRPGDPDLLRMLVGIDLASNGEPAAFATIARLQSDPINAAGARTLTADLFVFTKHYREAGEAYAELLKTMPTSIIAQSAITAYINAGLAAPAGALMRDWLSKHPDDIDMTRGLGAMELANHQYDSARGLLEKVVARDPGDPVALNNLAWIYQKEKDPRALATARRAFLRQPTGQSADTLGWILTTQGDAAGALPLLTSAANALKTDPTVQFHLGVALKALGKTTEAVAVLRPIASQQTSFEEQPEARRLLAELAPAK